MKEKAKNVKPVKAEEAQTPSPATAEKTVPVLALKQVYKRVTHKVELITPEKARKFLANRAPNRNVHRNNVHHLVSEILKGNYKPNGSPIVIDQYGRLMDGQHRCLAISEAGIPVYSDIKYGQNYEDTIEIIDGPRQPRSYRDRSAMYFPDLPVDTFAIAKSILNFEMTGRLLKVSAEINDTEVRKFVEANRDFFLHLKNNRPNVKKPSFIKNFTTFKVLEYILGKIDAGKDKTEDFFRRLFENTLVADTPEYTLVSWLDHGRQVKRQDGTRLGWVYGLEGNKLFANALIYAWNAKVNGKSIQNIRLTNRHGESNVPDIYKMYKDATTLAEKRSEKPGGIWAMLAKSRI